MLWAKVDKFECYGNPDYLVNTTCSTEERENDLTYFSVSTYFIKPEKNLNVLPTEYAFNFQITNEIFIGTD